MHIGSTYFYLLQKLTNDPYASMYLVPENGDGDTYIETGIQIHCYLSNKPFRMVEELSGGEKTIVSLAFLCALQK